MQTSIPQVWKATLDEQVCREDRQGFLLDLIESEVLPRLPEDRRTTFLHIGANSLHLTNRIAEFFLSTHVVEPNSYQLPLPEDMETLAVHTEDVLSINFPERFDFVLCDHLLHSLATSSARADPQAYLGHLVDKVLEEGSVALLGTLAPRGPLHDFLTAINPGYVGSAAVQQALVGMPNVSYWVVERSNVASLRSAQQLERLLGLHAFLVRQQGEGQQAASKAAAAAAGEEGKGMVSGEAAMNGQVVMAGPPAGASSAGAGGADVAEGADLAEAELVRRYVEEAADGAGRYNWVEEDDMILLQKMPLPVVEAV